MHLTMQLHFASFETTLVMPLKDKITVVACSQRAEPALNADFDGFSSITIGIKVNLISQKRINPLTSPGSTNNAHTKCKTYPGH